MAHQVFVLRRIHCTIPTQKLSTYVPKSTSFAPTRTDLAGKLLSIYANIDNVNTLFPSGYWYEWLVDVQTDSRGCDCPLGLHTYQLSTALIPTKIDT